MEVNDRYCDYKIVRTVGKNILLPLIFICGNDMVTIVTTFHLFAFSFHYIPLHSIPFITLHFLPFFSISFQNVLAKTKNHLDTLYCIHAHLSKFSLSRRLVFKT